MKKIIILFFILISNSLQAQLENPRFQKFLLNEPNTSTPFAIKNEGKPTLAYLSSLNKRIKFITREWIYVNMTPTEIQEAILTKHISQFHFEFAPPALMADTARAVHHVNEVHQGISPLQSPYTGKNVIIGYVDQGIDFNHPDFLDENGNSRVIRYWDHTAASSSSSPQPYGYGQICDSITIVHGGCTLTESGTYHGTTVAGAGSGNGRANGKHKGMAPNSKIIAVETNFNFQNWTLSIADACDYIFKVADTLGLPAVVNLSVGSYYGSHDGNDPASIMMEALVDEKPGRIIVCAAGNSGVNGKYHAHGTTQNDTTFLWLKNNPTNQILPNSIFFEIWSDEMDFSNVSYAFNTNHPTSYTKGNYTQFRFPSVSFTHVIDTIKGISGSKLAIAESYCELQNNVYHLEVLIRSIDSLDYLFQFATFGQGSYDLWSGVWANLNEIVYNIPTTNTYPEIVHYILPDSIQTIVSSWACSEKIVTVGNVRNRLTHLNNNGTYYTNSDPTPVGTISQGSSRGPNRKGLMKPDIAANGDVMLSAAPLYMQMNPIYNSALEMGGWHARNGGTSMASPVVAGIAALYLEKCNQTTYADFLRDLHASGMHDSVTGTLPNFSYGYGKLDAFKLLVENGSILGDTSYCGIDIVQIASIGTHPIDSIIFNNTTIPGNSILIDSIGTYHFTVYYQNGCYSNHSKNISAGIQPITPTISVSGNVLSSSLADNYQWHKNGTNIPGAINQTYLITSGGSYVVSTTNTTGCTAYSFPYESSLSTDLIAEDQILIYPNPTENTIKIEGVSFPSEINLLDLNGKKIALPLDQFPEYQLGNITSGIYIIEIVQNSSRKYIKIVRN